MKSLERIPFLVNVLIVACSRPNAEVGKLLKALVTYATDGTRTDLDDIRLEAYFDLIAQDLDTLQKAAEVKSRKCSESAKCRIARNNSSSISIRRNKSVYISNIQTYMLNIGKTLDDKTVYNHNSCKYFCVRDA